MPKTKDAISLVVQSVHGNLESAYQELTSEANKVVVMDKQDLIAIDNTLIDVIQKAIYLRSLVNQKIRDMDR